MKVEEFIRISQNGGEKIIIRCGNYFRPHLWKCYSYPLYIKVSVTKELIKSLRWKYLITTIYTDSVKKNTYEFILRATRYDIQQFQTKKRNEIRQSLKYFTFKRPSLEDMMKFGIKINLKALKRQNRKERKFTNIKKWSKYIISLYSCEKVIVHGAYSGEELVGYMIVFQIDNKYNIHYAFINREATGNKSPMNGLIYTLANSIIKEKGSIILSYGVFSFIPKPELYKFKQDMLFEKLPSSRVYIINPVLLFFFSILIFINIKLLKKKSIKNNLIRIIISLYQGYRMLNKELKEI